MTETQVIATLADQMLEAALGAARDKKRRKIMPTKTKKPVEPATVPGDIEPGSVIRVTNWPGTQGLRFKVIEITPGKAGRATCHALEIEGGRPWRYRAFPLANCHLDPKATRKIREEASR